MADSCLPYVDVGPGTPQSSAPCGSHATLTSLPSIKGGGGGNSYPSPMPSNLPVHSSLRSSSLNPSPSYDISATTHTTEVRPSQLPRKSSRTRQASSAGCDRQRSDSASSDPVTLLQNFIAFSRAHKDCPRTVAAIRAENDVIRGHLRRLSVAIDEILTSNRRGGKCQTGLRRTQVGRPSLTGNGNERYLAMYSREASRLHRLLKRATDSRNCLLMKNKLKEIEEATQELLKENKRLRADNLKKGRELEKCEKDTYVDMTSLRKVEELTREAEYWEERNRALEDLTHKAQEQSARITAHATELQGEIKTTAEDIRDRGGDPSTLAGSRQVSFPPVDFRRRTAPGRGRGKIDHLCVDLSVDRLTSEEARSLVARREQLLWQQQTLKSAIAGVDHTQKLNAKAHHRCIMSLKRKIKEGEAEAKTTEAAAAESSRALESFFSSLSPQRRLMVDRRLHPGNSSPSRTLPAPQDPTSGNSSPIRPPPAPKNGAEEDICQTPHLGPVASPRGTQSVHSSPHDPVTNVGDETLSPLPPPRVAECNSRVSDGSSPHYSNCFSSPSPRGANPSPSEFVESPMAPHEALSPPAVPPYPLAPGPPLPPSAAPVPPAQSAFLGFSFPDMPTNLDPQITESVGTNIDLASLDPDPTNVVSAPTTCPRESEVPHVGISNAVPSPSGALTADPSSGNCGERRGSAYYFSASPPSIDPAPQPPVASVEIPNAATEGSAPANTRPPRRRPSTLQSEVADDFDLYANLVASSKNADEVAPPDAVSRVEPPTRGRTSPPPDMPEEGKKNPTNIPEGEAKVVEAPPPKPGRRRSRFGGACGSSTTSDEAIKQLEDMIF